MLVNPFRKAIPIRVQSQLAFSRECYSRKIRKCHILKPSQNAEEQTSEIFRMYEEDVRSVLELTFPNGPVQNRHVRQASVIVRRWLCDNELRHLAREVQAPITFPVLDDTAIFKLVENDADISYYLSAGVKFDGKPIWALYHSYSDMAPPWAGDIRKSKIIMLKLGQALKQPVLHFAGETFSLDATLRFACNKLGGAHYDLTRKGIEEKLDAAARYLTFGPPEEMLATSDLGTIHLPLERTGTEVLSGISVVVIVAATMLVNVHIGGEPVFELQQARAAYEESRRAPLTEFRQKIRSYFGRARGNP